MHRLAGLLLLLLLAACKPPQQAQSPPARSFYYWKSINRYDNTDDSTARALGIGHFYVHLLDIDWSEALGEAIPVFSPNYFYNPFYARHDYTPVVFITPRSFARMQSDAEADTLAARIFRKIGRQREVLEEQATQLLMERDYGWRSGTNYDSLRRAADSAKNALHETRRNYPTEIQIDCDWTTATRDRYFAFLKALKALAPDKKLSATIRLYPYKYRQKMGVPPVDRGLLMAYNLSPAGSEATANSILDVAELKKYLKGADDYPLPLDGALPLFGWSIWLRNGKLMGILHEFRPETLGDRYVAKRSDAAGEQYRILADTVVGGSYLRAGDVLRDETVSPETLKAAAALLRPRIERLAFFHWNDSVARYAPLLEDLYR